MGNIVAMSTNYYAKVAAIIQEMLMKVGLKFEVTTFEQATVEQQWYWDHSEECAIVCHGDNIKIDSGAFYTAEVVTRMGFVSQEDMGFTDKLVETGAKASSEYDDAIRNELWKEFWTEMKEQGIYYSLFHRDNMYISTKELNPVLGVYYYRYYDWNWA